MQNEPVDDTWEEQKRSAAPLFAQVLLLFLAGGAFASLVLTLSQGSFVLGSRGWEIFFELVVLLIVLIFMILLLRPVYITRLYNRHPLNESDPLLIVGCKGCGHMFERHYTDIDEEHEQHFRCPQCDRPGTIHSLRAKKHDELDVDCFDCGLRYRTFQNYSECPRCESVNEIPGA